MDIVVACYLLLVIIGLGIYAVIFLWEIKNELKEINKYIQNIENKVEATELNTRR